MDRSAPRATCRPEFDKSQFGLKAVAHRGHRGSCFHLARGCAAFARCRTLEHRRSLRSLWLGVGQGRASSDLLRRGELEARGGELSRVLPLHARSPGIFEAARAGTTARADRRNERRHGSPHLRARRHRAIDRSSRGLEHRRASRSSLSAMRSMMASRPAAPTANRSRRSWAISRDYDGGVTSTHFAPSSFFIAYPDHGVIYRFIPLTAHSSAMELIWLVKGDAGEGVDYDLDKLSGSGESPAKRTSGSPRITRRASIRASISPVLCTCRAQRDRWIEWYLGEVA